MPYARRNTLTWYRGGYYHIYNRGAHKLNIFSEPEDYLSALRRVKRYSQTFHIAVIAYCLMPNHYHLLVRQDGETSAGLLPQRVFNGYTKAYNARHGHSGTLFEHRYQAKHVSDEAYLLHLCRYIHANPVKDGLVADPGDWPYSNYLEWVGEREGSLVDQDLIQAYVDSPEAYRTLVLGDLPHPRLPRAVEIFLADLELPR